MEQKINDRIEIKDKLIYFVRDNKKKLIISLVLILIFSIILSIFNIYEDKKNNQISEKYIQAGLLIASDEFEKSKKILEEIINKKNKFYSILALNLILEKNLEQDKNKILNYFSTLEKTVSSNSQKDLILFKKSLFLIKNTENEKGKEILKKLIENDSKFKVLAREILEN